MKFIYYSLFRVIPFLVLANTAHAYCYSEVIPSTPSADFTVHGDGTVTHNNTSLMWKVCSEEQSWNNNNCTGGEAAYGSTWGQALQFADALNSRGGYAGYTDWRLPNISELASIVEVCGSPPINEEIFPSTITDSRSFWSSSPSPDASQGWGHPDIPGDTNAWILSYDGSEKNQNRGNSARIRLVRDAP